MLRVTAFLLGLSLVAACTDPPIPLFASFTLTSYSQDNAVDVGAGDQTVSCTAGVSSAAGPLRLVACIWEDPTGQDIEVCQSNNPSTGSRTAGTWTCTGTIKQHTSPGTWKLREIIAQDNAGLKEREVNADILSGLALPASALEIVVTSSPLGTDKERPVIYGVTALPSPLSIGQTLTCSVSVWDLKSPTKNISCTAVGPTSQKLQCTSTGSSCDITIPAGSALGVWDVSATARDNNNNIRCVDSVTTFEVQ